MHRRPEGKLGDKDRAHTRYASAAFSLDAVHSHTVGLPKSWILLTLCMLAHCAVLLLSFWFAKTDDVDGIYIGLQTCNS